MRSSASPTKKLIIFMITVFSVLSCFVHCFAEDTQNNPYIKVPSMEVDPEEPVICPTEPFATLPVDCWVGQRIIFMPISESLQRFGYQRIEHSLDAYANIGKRVTYKEAVGRVGTITAVTYDIPYKDMYTITITMEDGQTYFKKNLKKYKKTESINDIAFLKDIDDARKVYVGKKYWHYDQLVEIINVGVSDSDSAPVRFYTKSPSGVESHVDVYLGKTNVRSPGNSFDYYFSNIDPEIKRKAEEKASKAEEKAFRDKYRKYKWSEKTWKSIESGKVFIGMTKLQATLSWGEPESINKTSGSWGVHEQWVYGGNNYLYFENGKLKSIQN